MGLCLTTGTADKAAKVWDAATGKELLTLCGHGEEVECVAWIPDGKRLATASKNGTGTNLLHGNPQADSTDPRTRNQSSLVGRLSGVFPRRQVPVRSGALLVVAFPGLAMARRATEEWGLQIQKTFLVSL